MAKRKKQSGTQSVAMVEQLQRSQDSVLREAIKDRDKAMGTMMQYMRGLKESRKEVDKCNKRLDGILADIASGQGNLFDGGSAPSVPPMASAAKKNGKKKAPKKTALTAPKYMRAKLMEIAMIYDAARRPYAVALADHLADPSDDNDPDYDASAYRISNEEKLEIRHDLERNGKRIGIPSCQSSESESLDDSIDKTDGGDAVPTTGEGDE